MVGPLLLHSVSYSGSWGQAFLPVEEFLDKASELNFDGVPVDFIFDLIFEKIQIFKRKSQSRIIKSGFDCRLCKKI